MGEISEVAKKAAIEIDREYQCTRYVDLARYGLERRIQDAIDSAFIAGNAQLRQRVEELEGEQWINMGHEDYPDGQRRRLALKPDAVEAYVTDLRTKLTAAEKRVEEISQGLSLDSFLRLYDVFYSNTLGQHPLGYSSLESDRDRCICKWIRNIYQHDALTQGNETS